jgi:hypothetical protein
MLLSVKVLRDEIQQAQSESDLLCFPLPRHSDSISPRRKGGGMSKLAVWFACLLLGACSLQRAQMAENAQSQLWA